MELDVELDVEGRTGGSGTPVFSILGISRRYDFNTTG